MSSRATSGPLAGSDSCKSVAVLAGEPGSGGVAHRTPLDLPTKRLDAAAILVVGLAATLLALWLAVDPRTPDLAAQVYRAGLFGERGLAIWDARWYAGHNLPGYSLLFPPLASLLGLRTVAGLSLLASAALFQRLTFRVYGRSARWAAAWFACAAAADIWIGRLAFALGVSFALGAMLAFVRARTLPAVVLAALCAASSPAAGALLVLAALTHAVSGRTRRSLLVLAAPVAVVVASLTLLFPEGGAEPYPILSFAATVLVVVTFLYALPAGQRLMRTGAIVYLLGCIACLLIHTPMGSNIERYAVLLAGPLLLCALGDRSDGASSGEALVASGRVAPGRRPLARLGLTPAAAVALCAWAVWVGWGPVRETLAVAGNESTKASYYAPVERFLGAHSRGPVRVEVPLTRSHWEAALLAPTVSLARGWEKQLDARFDAVLLARGLTAAAYRRWLGENAVGYVALPDAALDPSSATEGKLIRAGLPYLNEVFASPHWRLYAVLTPTPLATGPGRLTALGHDTFSLRAYSRGSFLVRVHFSRYLTITHGAGCVGPTPGGWTSILARAPGTLDVQARFSLGRALGLEGSCATDGVP
jgi:hypothetical protein